VHDVRRDPPDAEKITKVLIELARQQTIESPGAYANGYLCGLDISLYGVLLPRGLVNQIGGNSHSAVCRP